MANVVPLYQSMLTDLIRQIEAGELQSNSKLPSEQKLGDLYHVSRITVRRALAELERKQYIYKKQGQGSFVLQTDDPELGARYLDVHKAIVNMDAVAKIELESFQLLVDGSATSAREALGLGKDDYLYQLKYMFYADDVPTYHEIVYLPYERFPNIFASELANNDLMPFLVKKYGLEASFFNHTKAGLITKDNRQIFKLNVGAPLVNLQTSGVEKRELVYYSTATVVGNLTMFILD